MSESTLISRKLLKQVYSTNDEVQLKEIDKENLPTITMELVKANPYVMWNYDLLSYSKGITILDLIRNRDKDWNYHAYYIHHKGSIDMNYTLQLRIQYPKIYLNIIKKNPQIIWHYVSLSMNASLGEIVNNPDISWDSQAILNNPKITWHFIMNDLRFVGKNMIEVYNAFKQSKDNISSSISWATKIAYNRWNNLNSVQYVSYNIFIDPIHDEMLIDDLCDIVNLSNEMLFPYLIYGNSDIAQSWQSLSCNPVITDYIIAKYYKLPWSIIHLRDNPSITPTGLDNYLKKRKLIKVKDIFSDNPWIV